MALSSGAKLGPYEITAPLGAGGMGEVYRARDTRLDRSVAVKILPAHMAEKPEAGERFEREARTISSLNHPNICQLHDVGSQEGTRYLVMELLEGETLAERLRRGPLPLDQVLRYGAEIARGLHAAHRFGVVHRDLKPGNIMLTKSGAKLMDFGLAKGVSPVKNVSTELTATLTSSHATPLTQQGTIIGTFQFMSPEQMEGKEADARSDIFSLGAVLYEMTTGKRAFEGKTLVSVAASILEREPTPIKSIQPLTPVSLERLVHKCLAKDPDERWQSAGDLASELHWIAEGDTTPPTAQKIGSSRMRVSEWLAWMFLTMAVIAVTVLSMVMIAGHNESSIVRTQIASSEKLQFNFVGDGGGPPVISPDGTQLVFSAKIDGKSQLALRPLDSLTPRPLVGTQDGTFPFWSPDGRSVAFFAEGKLKRIDVGGGPAVAICDAANARGGDWGRDGTILLEPFPTLPLSRVPAAGGTPQVVTKLSGKFTTHRWPQFLPDGHHFLYLAANHSDPVGLDTAVFWASFDGKDNKLLVHSFSNAIYAAGYLIYVRESALMARPFNPSTSDFQGDPRVLNDDIQVDRAVWRGTFTVSDRGPLIYQPGAANAGMKLTWMDRTGKELGNVGAPDAYNHVELSPDSKRIAFTVGNPTFVIWIYDLEKNTRTRFTFGTGSASSPLWSRDGKQIAYMATQGAGSRYVAMVKAADGSTNAKSLDAPNLDNGGAQQALWDWSPDGKYLLYRAGPFGAENGVDIWALPMTGDGKAFAYITGPGQQTFAQFSPDGKWVAYESDENGRDEIYVVPFPWTGAKWQISNTGGIVPRWRRDGKEILFQELGNPFTWSAQVEGRGSNFYIGQVHPLFESDDLSPNIAAAQFAITGDAQRFLEITTGEAGKLPLTVIQNWTAEVKKK